MHLKRHKSPKNWPIKRKGTKYVVRPNFNSTTGLPVLVLLRDVLELAKTRKEVKKALNEKQVLLNHRPISDEKNAALLFDVISILPSNKHYQLGMSEFGKFNVKEIKSTEANEKVAKILDKKIIKGKKVQINLSDGNNFLYEGKFNINDSAVIDLKARKISKIIPFKENVKAVVFAGKHSGKEGIIESIDKEKKMVGLKLNGDKINILIKQIIAIQ